VLEYRKIGDPVPWLEPLERAFCRSDRLGLSDDLRGALTGFTHRVFSALAHLVSAWSIADATNVRAVEQEMAALLEARSIKACRPLVLEALSSLIHRAQQHLSEGSGSSFPFIPRHPELSNLHTKGRRHGALHLARRNTWRPCHQADCLAGC
jgi:hypothetical protein